jgi:hypothetical protein
VCLTNSRHSALEDPPTHGRPAFLATDCGVQTDTCLHKHVLKFKRLRKIRIQDHAVIRHALIGARRLGETRIAFSCLIQDGSVRNTAQIALHGTLHRQPNSDGAGAFSSPSDAVKTRNGAIGGLFGYRCMLFHSAHGLLHPVGCRSPEHHNIDKRVRAQPVGAVHRDAGGFSDCHQFRDD